MLNELNETEKQLKAFRDYVVKESKFNLTRLKKNSSKRLYDSIKGEYKVMPNSFSMEFDMEDYGTFQDKGVNGLEVNRGSKYSFSKGFPSREMLNSLDKWIVRKGIAPRNKKGEFVNRLGLKFAIAKNIFKRGIKPSLFFTKPFENAFKKLPNELIEKFGLDVVKLFDNSITQPTKK